MATVAATSIPGAPAAQNAAAAVGASAMAVITVSAAALASSQALRPLSCAALSAVLSASTCAAALAPARTLAAIVDSAHALSSPPSPSLLLYSLHNTGTTAVAPPPSTLEKRRSSAPRMEHDAMRAASGALSALRSPSHPVQSEKKA